MNPTIACSKKCYRCQNVVRMTAEEFRASPDEFTCCSVCREKLSVEAGFAGVAHPDFADWKRREAEVLDALCDGHPNPEGYMERWYAHNPRPTDFPKNEASTSIPAQPVSAT